MKNIVRTTNAGSFETLVKIIKAAGLVEPLSDEGPFTVFAPTDEAFSKLPKRTIDSLFKDKKKLTSVLTYHVVPGKVMSSDVMRLKTAKTVQGGMLSFNNSRGVKVNNANIIKADIVTSKGVIHAIDSVLMPK